MSFIKGFLKVADMDHNNQGLEFNTSNNEPYQAGAGQMAPTGIPLYMPTGGGVSAKINPKKKDATAVNIALGKYANSMLGNSQLGVTGALDGSSPQGQGASTLVSQLKWESSGLNRDDPSPVTGGKADKKNIPSLMRLKKKGVKV